MRKVILVLTIAIVAISCKKIEDTQAPEIVIMSPTEEAKLSLNTIVIKVSVTDADLHNVGYAITRKIDGSQLYNNPPTHVHDSPFEVNETINITGINSETQAILTVNAADHNENRSSKSVVFTIKP